MRIYYLIGSEFQFGRMKSFGGGWGRWLYKNVNELNTTGLYT